MGIDDTADAVANLQDGVEANKDATSLNSDNGKMDQESRFQEERDAAADEREKISRGDVYWSRDHATSNAMQSSDGRLLLTMCDAGFQYLLAGTRCSVGVKGGRYFFEVKVVEMLNPAEAQRPTVRTPLPRQLLRLGVSTKPNLLLLDDSGEAAYFDSEGYFVCGSTRTRASAQFSRDHVVGFLINMDPSSANANTVSLFRDGVRVADPQRLPESLVGKVLYPCITWKNMTLQISLGPEPKKPLPFTCRMLNDAAAADLEVTQARKKDKFEVLFPVGLPEQGLFDWMDGFLEENHHYVELSDRQVVAWAANSGALPRGQPSSIDKPGVDFGIPLIDDMNVQKTLASLAPAMKRDLVFMELRSNLVAAERKASLVKFPPSRFKRVAVVVMGEPPAAFKAKVHKHILADKLKGSRKDDDGADSKRRKLDGEPDCKEDEKSVELTDEEKNMWYYKREIPDLSQAVLAKDLANFSLPAQEEGFDEIRYVWQNEDISKMHMRTWILDLKKTLKAEHLEPSIWFKDQFTAWCKLLTDLRRKQNDVKQKRKGAAHDASKAEGEDRDEAVLEEVDIKRQRDADEAYETGTVESIDDIGNGRPLFAHFEYEDWVLLGLRFEFHLLVHAFRKDLDDPDRPSFSETHLLYYYNKYYKKNLNLSLCKLKAVPELIALVKDTVSIDTETGFLQTAHSDDIALDKFVRLTEECRRERQRCIDAGDETATLEFSKPPPASPPPPKGDDKGSASSSRYGDRAPASSTASRGPVLHGGEPRGSVGRSVYPQGGGKGAAPPRSSYPPAPARGSYGAPPSQKRPMPSVPPTAPYASKQPRYGTGAGGVGPSSVPRSTYPPHPPPQGGRRYH